jgi:endogenous inhibitor of DNA gyrase (YacG/DUF329 family)
MLLSVRTAGEEAETRMATRITGTMVSAVLLPREARPRTWEVGRTCAATGCATILSIYNSSRFCSLHSTEIDVAERRKPRRAMRLVACEHCGKQFETNNPMRKYCSDRCRMAAYNARESAEHVSRSCRKRSRAS